MLKKPRKRTRNGQINRRRHKLRKRITSFGIWNVQGFSRKINEAIYELNRLNMDIVVITETKRKGQGSENIGEYDYF